MPSLYPIYCYSRYRFTRYFDNGKTCFDCDFLKFHRYNRYILTTGHFIADTDCTRYLQLGQGEVPEKWVYIFVSTTHYLQLPLCCAASDLHHT